MFQISISYKIYTTADLNNGLYSTVRWSCLSIHTASTDSCANIRQRKNIIDFEYHQGRKFVNYWRICLSWSSLAYSATAATPLEISGIMISYTVVKQNR